MGPKCFSPATLEHILRILPKCDITESDNQCVSTWKENNIVEAVEEIKPTTDRHSF